MNVEISKNLIPLQNDTTFTNSEISQTKLAKLE